MVMMNELHILNLTIYLNGIPLVKFSEINVFTSFMMVKSEDSRSPTSSAMSEGPAISTEFSSIN